MRFGVWFLVNSWGQLFLRGTKIITFVSKSVKFQTVCQQSFKQLPNRKVVNITTARWTWKSVFNVISTICALVWVSDGGRYIGLNYYLLLELSHRSWKVTTILKRAVQNVY